jgi:NAD(P)-dependent dehydrogenase (short-subunit alcohol dehydrogenase family)
VSPLHSLVMVSACSFHAVDLADPLSVAWSGSATVASCGRIDCVVNSAGITTLGTLLNTTVELFDAHIAINLRARIALSDHATAGPVLPRTISRGSRTDSRVSSRTPSSRSTAARTAHWAWTGAS